MKKWSSVSQLGKTAIGPTHVQADIWNTSFVVKQLTTESNDFIESQVGVFPVQIYRRVEKMMLESIYRYTGDFGFNKIMMLLRFLDLEGESETPLWYEFKTALAEWRRQDAELIMHTRIMAHITANCSYRQDLKVYRGFKDRRMDAPRLGSKEEAQAYLKSVGKITDLENEITNLFGRTITIHEAIHGMYNPDDLKDTRDQKKVIDLARQIKSLQVDVNLDSRDVERLVHGVGEAIENETFMSTSLSIEQARRFMGENCCLLEITVPAGTPCFYVSPFSAFQGAESEFEVVLPPCAKLVVLGRSGGITRVRYMGISDDARHRLSLDLPRLYIMQQMSAAIERGRTAERSLKFNIGLFRVCRKFTGTHEYVPLQTGESFTTFSNDKLETDWNPQMEMDYTWDPNAKGKSFDDVPVAVGGGRKRRKTSKTKRRRSRRK
jgi:hypothetical protein